MAFDITSYILGKKSGGGGGGGSSDFSTATVTVTSLGARIDLPVIQSFPEYPDYSGIYPFCDLESGDTQVTVPLYKGVAWFLCSDDITVSALSGDIVFDGDGYYKITGDCTITISSDTLDS